MKIIYYRDIVNFAEAALRCDYYADVDDRMSAYNLGKSYAYFLVLEKLGYLFMWHEMGEDTIDHKSMTLVSRRSLDDYKSQYNAIFVMKTRLFRDALELMELTHASEENLIEYYKDKL